MDHLASLHEAGSLLAAGPLTGGAGSAFRGLSILRVPVDQARALKEADPAVRAGRYTVTVLPWMVPGGAVQFRAAPSSSGRPGSRTQPPRQASQTAPRTRRPDSRWPPAVGDDRVPRQASQTARGPGWPWTRLDSQRYPLSAITGIPRFLRRRPA